MRVPLTKRKMFLLIRASLGFACFYIFGTYAVTLYDISSLSASVVTTVKPRSIQRLKINQTKNTCPYFSTSPKTILWYDFYHGGSGQRGRARQVDFNKCSCPCKLKYFFRNDSDYFLKKPNSPVRTDGPFDADAVLIQLIRTNFLGHPPERKPNQIFVAVEREAGPAKTMNSFYFNYVYNWTMTYRTDSDIFYPYGSIVSKAETVDKIDYSQIFKDKQKGIIWFVSHCKTRSKRERFVKELEQYIPVDIYGDCSTQNLTCPRHGREAKRCMPKLIKKYMFRLAFENTYHRDYVTEKLFDWFPENIVLVVLGAANYSDILPKGTYIDVKDFNSAKDLADYLKLLMTDEEQYTAYLKRKENYTSSEVNFDQSAYCQLCEMLHNHKGYQRTYADIAKWWTS